MDPRWAPNFQTELGFVGDYVKTKSIGMGSPANSWTKEAALIMREAANKRLTEEYESDGDLMHYGNSRGDPKFRIELAKFLNRQYGLSHPVDKDELICSAGSTQSLFTIGSLLFQPGDIAFIEDPTYWCAGKLLKNDCKLQLVPVPRDDTGMNMDALEKLMIEYKDKGTTQMTEKRPFRSLIYLVPTFHNPTGQCMTPEQCQRVVQLAREHDSLVFSDDVYNCVSWITEPDGSFANPPTRLKAYDNKSDVNYKGHVLSSGTFSKFMSPGLRLGWWEAPSRIHDIIRQSGYMDIGGFNQFTGGIIGTAMELGLVDKQAQAMRKSFQEKVRVVCKVLRDKMPRGVNFEEPKGGYFIWIQFPEDFDVRKLLRKCIDAHDVSFLPGQNCSANGENFKNCIRIAFSYYSKEELVDAVTNIAATTIKMMQQSKYIMNNTGNNNNGDL